MAVASPRSVRSRVLSKQSSLELSFSVDGHSTRTWSSLSQCVDDFIEAWQTSGQPPGLAGHRTFTSSAARRCALIELIKVDLDFRLQHGCARPLEDYLEEFPELLEIGSPVDLIYEDLHLRRAAGERVDTEGYCARFPEAAERLRRLCALETSKCRDAVATANGPPQFAVGQQVDEFMILGEIGSGSFANVYLARQMTLDRLLAIKVSPAQGAEPTTLAQLDHPHIVRVHDQRLLDEGATRLLYMEYAAGGTLRSVIKAATRVQPAERSGKTFLRAVGAARAADTNGSSPAFGPRQFLTAASWWQTVCWVGSRVAAAMDHAHQQGLLHCDIKPANILLTAEGSPKLADFNITFHLHAGLGDGHFGGSLAYMSPEQLEAHDQRHARQPEELTAASDIYALSIVLWEMLTGQRPFDDKPSDEGPLTTMEEMTARRRQGVAIEAIEQLPADCPAALKAVLLKCLQPEPSDRYTDAGQLARALELCLDADRQESPPQPGRWQRLLLRHPLLSLLVAGVAPNLALCLVIVAYLWNAIVDSPLTTAFGLIALFGVGLLLAFRLSRALRERLANREEIV